MADTRLELTADSNLRTTGFGSLQKRRSRRSEQRGPAVNRASSNGTSGQQSKTALDRESSSRKTHRHSTHSGISLYSAGWGNSSNCWAAQSLIPSSRFGAGTLTDDAQ